MAIFSWFSKKKSSEEDYEQVLASLALSIQKRQTRLSEIRLRERRATLLFTSWAFSAWVGYVALWWAGVVGGRGRAGQGNVFWGLPVVLGPVVILFARRIVQLWYARKGNAEENTLKQLLVQQRNKIEEIKKKTNYYSTKNLLDRYDEPIVTGSKTSVASGVQRRAHLAQSQLQPPSTPNRSTVSGPGYVAPSTPSRNGLTGSPGSQHGESQPFSPTLPPLPPPRKQWYDKLADAILGDDTASIGPSPASRYALICERCFSHNGLVKEEQWEDAQYLCPKCGHFNRSVRSRKAALMSATSPQPVVSPSNPSLPHSDAISGPSSASTNLTPQESTSQAKPLSPQSPPSPASGDHESSTTKPALSASTVFVEMSDAENPESKVAGYDVGEPEGNGGEPTMHMDVDSTLSFDHFIDPIRRL